jgi:hypothetical protein
MNDACGLRVCAKICHILDVLGLFLALRHTAKLQARITYNMFGSGSKFKATRGDIDSDQELLCCYGQNIVNTMV